MRLYSVGVGASVLLGGCSGLSRAATVDPAQSLRDEFAVHCQGRLDCLQSLLVESEWQSVARWLQGAPRTFREPAGRSEAMRRLAAVARAVPEVRRRFYYYDALLIPGSPPRADGSPSWLNEHRLDLAERMYDAGLAPWIVVSGGAVHGKHVEARILATAARQRGLPGEAIIEEPWARHTTENVRYTAILGLDRGWRRVLVVSDRFQTALIARFTRDGAYGGPSARRVHLGHLCVQLDLRRCPTAGYGPFGLSRKVPPGSPRCGDYGAGSKEPPKQKLSGAQ